MQTWGVPGRTYLGLAEHQMAWPNHPVRGRSILAGGTWLPRHNPLVILYAGTFRPRYEAGEVKTDVQHTLAGGQRCCHIAAITGEAYLRPCPAYLTMTNGQRGYRVRQPGMARHIEHNQGRPGGMGEKRSGTPAWPRLSLPSQMSSYRCKTGAVYKPRHCL